MSNEICLLDALSLSEYVLNSGDFIYSSNISILYFVGLENDPGDLWYDDGSSCEDSVEKLNRASDMDREWQRRRDQFHTVS